MSVPHPSLTAFTPKAAASGSATEFRCSLCGVRFTHGTLVCGACPLNAGCEVVKCPSCGFQFPRKSRVVDLLRRWLGSGARA